MSVIDIQHYIHTKLWWLNWRMKFKHFYSRSEHVAPILVGMNESSVWFQEIGVLGFLLAFYPPSDISSDHIIKHPKVVTRQGRMAWSCIKFQTTESHI